MMSGLIIEPILEDELYTTPPLMKVVVAKLVGCKQDIPRVFRLTQNEVSISELKHLRRIKDLPDGRIECILCKLRDDDNDCNSIERVSERYASEKLFEDYRITLVPSSAPKTDHQLSACSKLWPCKYAKSNYLIKCMQGTALDDCETLVLDIVVNSLIEFVRASKFTSAAVVFRFAQVYGLGLSNANVVAENPVKHSVMLAIDSVAQGAGCGHWRTGDCITHHDDPERKLKDDKSSDKSSSVMNGMREKLNSQEILKDHKIEETFLPYLCTNYDIFVTEEPCMMCTMGLVQSRIRRLFYLDREDAARLFGNAGKLCYPDKAIERFLVHRDRSLNHRFEAWRIRLGTAGAVDERGRERL